MSEFSLPVQTAIYNRLSAELATNIYDDVPDLPEGMPEDDFPYIVIGDDTHQAWDRDDTVGARVTVTLHVYSRYSGMLQIKTIVQNIYTALNRQSANLSASGYNFVDCLFEYSDFRELRDGKTRHAVCRYRILIEKE